MSKKIIDLYHILLCNKPHSYNIESFDKRKDGVCYYYVEDCISNGSEMEDHQTWIVLLADFQEALHLENEKELERFLKDTLDISQKVAYLIGDYHERLVFIQELIKSLESRI